MKNLFLFLCLTFLYPLSAHATFTLNSTSSSDSITINNPSDTGRVFSLIDNTGNEAFRHVTDIGAVDIMPSDVIKTTWTITPPYQFGAYSRYRFNTFSAFALTGSSSGSYCLEYAVQWGTEADATYFTLYNGTKTLWLDQTPAVNLTTCTNLGNNCQPGAQTAFTDVKNCAYAKWCKYQIGMPNDWSGNVISKVGFINTSILGNTFNTTPFAISSYVWHVQVTDCIGHIITSIYTGGAPSAVTSDTAAGNLHSLGTIAENKVTSSGLGSGYVWRTTLIDGVTFRDQSTFATVNSGDTWTWVDTNNTASDLYALTTLGSVTAGYSVGITRNGALYATTGHRIGTNLVTGLTPSCDNSAGGACTNVNDNNFTTHWAPNNSSAGHYACFTFGSATTVNKAYLHTAGVLNGTTPLGVSLQASGDGCTASSMTTVLAQTKVTALQSSLTFNFTATTQKYWRFILNTNTGTPQVEEVGLYNEAQSSGNFYSDFSLFEWELGTTSIINPDFRWTSAVTNSDGSITLSNTISFNSQTLTMSETITQITNTTFRKRMTFIPSTASNLLVRSVAYKEPTAPFVCTDSLNYIQTCATQDYSSGTTDATLSPMIESGLMAPYWIVIAADNGCNGQYVSREQTSSNNIELNGVTVGNSNLWVEAYITNSKNYQGYTEFNMVNVNTPYTFDVIYGISQDPYYFRAREQGMVSLAEAHNKLNYQRLEKNLWGMSYQYLRQPVLLSAFCYEYDTMHDTASNEGMQPIFSYYQMAALGDKNTSQQIISDWQNGACSDANCSVYLSFDDTLNQSPPSFTNAAKDPRMMSWIVGYAASKGFVTFQSSCPDTLDCVTYTARNALYSALDALIPTNGWPLTQLLSYFGFIANLSIYPDNATDSTALDLGWDIAAMKYMQQACSIGTACAAPAFNTTKLNNLITNYTTLYNSTDGYQYFSRWGDWQTISDANASGGQYYEGQGDGVNPDGQPNMGATARFVVPASVTSAVFQVSYVTNPSYGIAYVFKNGTTSGSNPTQIAMYSSVKNYATTSFGTSTISTGDVLTFQVQTTTKNASSTAYKISIDALTICPVNCGVSGTTYQENDVNWACGTILRCTNGYTDGWKKWKMPQTLIGQFISVANFGVYPLTIAQTQSHISKMPTGNQSEGTYLNYMTLPDGSCPAIQWFIPEGATCKFDFNGGSYQIFDLMNLKLARDYLGNQAINYNWDDKALKIIRTQGNWQNISSPSYYQNYATSSSSGGTWADTLTLSGVPFDTAYVYAVTGTGMGTVELTTFNGTTWGTVSTVYLLNATNPIYTTTPAGGYSTAYQIRFKNISGQTALDYITTHTKPDFLYSERLAQDEYSPGGLVKPYIGTNIFDYNYQNLPAPFWYGWNSFALFGLITPGEYACDPGGERCFW